MRNTAAGVAPGKVDRPPERWQRMFDAAEALARLCGPAAIVQAEKFDADLLRHCIATAQPLVFHSLPRDWACGNRDAAGVERACGDLRCSDPPLPELSFRRFMSQLRDGSFRGTGGFPASAELVRWSGLPSQTGTVVCGHAHLFGGAQGAVTPLHRDAGDGLNVHVLGRKQWTLLSPVLARELLLSAGHAATGFQESDITLQQFEVLHAHAGFAGAPLRQVVSAGQAIFVPSGWFHEVQLLDVALSLAAPLFLGE